MAQQYTGIILTFIVKACRLHPCSLLISHSTKARFRLPYLCTIQATRKYCSGIILNNDTCDNKKVDRKCTDVHKNTDQSLVNTISNILSINTNEALKICDGFHETKKLSNDEIINIITILKEAGVSVPTIQNNIPILIQNMESLSKKLHCIMHLNDNMDEMFPLLNIDLKYLNILVVDEVHAEHNNGRNKIRYLADKLECSVYKLCELIVREPSLVTLSFNRVKTVINLLKEYNYESNDILNSLWLFKYSPRTIRRRSSSVKSAGVHIVKSWVIRCSINGLQRYINTLKKEAELTNIYGSHVALLSKKLNISEREVEFYVRRYPDILEVQLDKVNEVLDILIKYGYGPEDILLCQRIFLIRTSLLEERLKKLQSIRGQHRLTLVYCSNKVFEKAVKSANKLYGRKDI